MFTDVVGYTALMQQDEEAARIIRRRHREVLETAVSAHRGDLLQYLGDGSLTMFPSVVDAVHAAIEVQRGLRQEPVVPLRIGIHQGDISYDTQGAYGDSVNVASRIQSLGTAGSILVSAKARDEIKNQPDITTTPLGEFELKNVEESLEVYGIVADELTVPTRSDVLTKIRDAPATGLNATIRLNTALEGRYVIERELGEGGMATVYLADDLKHQRKVALKVLKPELAAVVGAERFLAEIKTTANLQHPHILPLFDSGEADGFLFYVMPYVEGESLRERLDREQQLPVDEAVRIVTNVAEALDYAHRQGVIHRDIKPANVLLQAGKPVISDFGIALALSAGGGSRLTETGLSLGTPHYMSPEQATGDQHVGPATDIYALGCVLYEMLVGEPPYTGGTAQAVLGKIIIGTADPVTESRASVPRNVDAAIRRALEKVPADRFGSAQDFADALADPGFRHGEDALSAVAASPGPWRGLSMALGALAFLFGIVAAWASLRPEPPQPVSRQVLSTVGWAGVDPAFGQYAAVAPDGSSMILPVGSLPTDVQLGLKMRGSAEVMPIPDTERARDVVYSPDGQWIAYVVGTELLKRSLVGGSPVTLAEDTDVRIVGLAWLDDGTILYEQFIPGSDRPGRIVRISEAGGEPLEVVFWPEEGPFAAGWVHGLPDARGALVIGCSGFSLCGTLDRANLYVLDLEDLSSELLLEQVARAWYAPTGHIVYVNADGVVFALPFDLGALRPAGSGVRLFEGVRVCFPTDMLLGADGTLLYVEGDCAPEGASQLVWVDRSGREEPVDANMPLQLYRTLALSPDDRRLAVTFETDNPAELWVKELPDGPLARLTTDPLNTRRPVWSIDGSTIAYVAASPLSTPHVRTVRSDGGSVGDFELLLQRERGVLEILHTPDGRGLIFRQGDASIGDADLGFVNLETGTIDESLLASEFNEAAIALSPDGRWLAYVSDLTGQNEVFVRPFPSLGSGRSQVSTNGGIEPVWAHHGRELFYREPNSGSMMVATYTSDPTFEVESREQLFDAGPYATTNGWRGYDVTSDNQRFVMIRSLPGEEAEAARLILVQNFFEELERLVPN